MKRATDPTPEEIRERCREIQAGWSRLEERNRRAADAHNNRWQFRVVRSHVRDAG